MTPSEGQRAAAQESGSEPDSGPAGPAGRGCCCPAGGQWRLCLGLNHCAKVRRSLQAGGAGQRGHAQDG